MISDLEYWLLLLKTPSVGTLSFLKALSHFGEPKTIFNADILSLKASKIFKKSALDWIQSPDIKSIKKDIEWQQQNNNHIITLIDDAYPDLLKEIPDPPPLLFVIGDIKLLKNPQIAIVGSRNPTQGGSENSYDFAKKLSNYNLTITSGMATGIDANAHLGALESGHKTIAVCGTGLDRIYPAKHKNLAHQISKQGLLISEFSIGTPAIAQNFPRRNRIISGLSFGTLVVEATLKSGSLITARLAAEQGREVFAIPSSINNPKAQGSHHLIKQGAKLVDCVDDIIEELPMLTLTSNNEKTDNLQNNIENEYISDSDILKYLSYEIKTVDELVEISNLTVENINQQLLLLELENKIELINGGVIKK
ncbi:Rossmann fold nucleotide-binding protein Smf possibly involved in DNA uptake [hydrothermal vent metagenome]|uniref:Rossmann fold nucleotide-binding protein Smf possibly involved in DNA uptake n=1 Tax=hydrothermal vent metagenome TaxID=652676 RepID=A0A1W1C9H4_9ZZZZ